MAKKTRTELSTLAINTNLPDNTTELITPTTERAQLTDERESVVNYKDDLGGTGNAGKFLTVAVDGESLTMVDEPSGVPAWVTFQTAASNLMNLLSGTNNVQIQFFYDDAGVDTLGARINFDGTSKTLLIGNDFYTAQLQVSNQFNFIQGGAVKLRIETTGDLTHNADIMALNAQQSFGSSPLYTFKFQGKVTGSSGGAFTFEEFANIKGGKENATENDKAGYLSFTTGIANGTLSEAMRISSGGKVIVGTDTSNALEVFSSGDTEIGFSYNTHGNIYAKIIGDITNANPLAGEMAFQTATDGTLTERMRISSGGLVQVGDGTSENTFLTTKSLAGWASGIKLTRGLGDGSDLNNNNFGMLVTDNGWEVSTFTSPLDNTTGRSAKLVISSEGAANFAGSVTNAHMMTIVNSKSTPYGIYQQFTSEQNNESSDFIRFQDGTEVKFYVYSNGNVKNKNNSYSAISDVKLKENIVDTPNKLNDILKVKVRNYNFKNDNLKQIGVIAQELESIFPSLVSESPDTEIIDKKVVDLGTTTKSVKYSVFVPILIKAIQEQQTIIESLITRLEALEA